MTKKPGLSIRAYAEHRKKKGLPGTSAWSVKKALRDGRITKNEQGRIDPKDADLQWDQNTNPAQQRDNQKLSKKAKQRIQQPPNSSPTGVPSYAQSRAVKEAYQARISRLQYEEMTGKLVSADQVKIEAFRRARMVRDQILAVPERVASILAAESKTEVVCEVLEDELRKALEVLSNV